MGNRHGEFAAVFMGYPPNSLGLTFLATRQCGVDLFAGREVFPFVRRNRRRMTPGGYQRVQPVTRGCEDTDVGDGLFPGAGRVAGNEDDASGRST